MNVSAEKGYPVTVYLLRCTILASRFKAISVLHRLLEYPLGSYPISKGFYTTLQTLIFNFSDVPSFLGPRIIYYDILCKEEVGE
jgi:hypothetical protein